jgi:hypothetical protein
MTGTSTSTQAPADPRERRRQAEQLFESYRYAHGRHRWEESARLRKLMHAIGFTVSLVQPPRLVELPGRVGSTCSTGPFGRVKIAVDQKDEPRGQPGLIADNRVEVGGANPRRDGRTPLRATPGHPPRHESYND